MVFELVRPPLNFLWRGLFKIRFKGTEHIPQTGGLIIAANHQTYIDPFWLSIPIKAAAQISGLGCRLRLAVGRQTDGTFRRLAAAD